MHPDVRNSTVHSSQDTAATEMSTNEWTDKEDTALYGITEYYSAIKRMKYCLLQQHGQT